MRKEGFELTNGSALIAAIPKVDGEYDLKTLSEMALSLKRDYPDATTRRCCSSRRSSTTT